MKKILLIILGFAFHLSLSAQINTDRVMLNGRNSLYYEDYVLSIQYFNLVIKAKPYLAEPYFFRAIAKYYLDDIKGAEDDCTLAINRNPFMTKAYQVRGDTRLALNDNEGALEDYKKALEIYPNDKFLLLNTSIAKTQDKKYEEAEEVFDRLLTRHPKYTFGYLAKGAMLQEKGDTLQALDNYNQAIELDKNLAQAYSMRGLLYLSKKEYDKALDDIDEAIILEPKLIGNYINRGLIKYSKNDLRGAMADYDKVVDIEPNNIIARFNRGLLRGQVGDNNRAIEDFNLVINHEPNNYIAVLNRGILQNSIGNYKGALKDLDVVLKEYPEFYQGYQMRAQIRRANNDLKGAENDYNHARQIQKQLKKDLASGKIDKDGEANTREKSDKDIDKFNLLVVADKTEQEKTKYDNKYRGQVQNNQVNLELKPRFIVSYYEKESGNISHLVRFSQQIERINKKRILPRSLLITNSLVALNELQAEDHFKSIDEISKQIAGDPSNALLYFGRGMDYMLVQDFSSAIVDFEKATKLDPSMVVAYYNLAVVYTKQLALKEDETKTFDNALNSADDDILLKEKNKETIIMPSVLVDPNKREYDIIMKSYDKVIDLDPDFIYAYFNRAELSYARKDYRSATLNYNEAIRHNPEFAEAYYNRGLCRFHLQDEKRALEDMRKAGELGVIEAYSIIKRMTN